MLPQRNTPASTSLEVESFLLDLPDVMNMDLTRMMEMTATARTTQPIFNTGASTLNTPEIDLPVDTFESIFNETEVVISNSPQSTALDLDYDIVESPECGNMENYTETVWGPETFVFGTTDFGICAPASLVEGADDNTVNAMDIATQATDIADPLEMENLDILQWVIDDQKLNDVSVAELEDKNFARPDVQRVSVIVPTKSTIAPAVSKVLVEVKTEVLTDIEKYRKMRDQNNESSKRCREKRKRKHQEAEEELIELQNRNSVLRATLDKMEREVKILKQKVLSDITTKN